MLLFAMLFWNLYLWGNPAKVEIPLRLQSYKVKLERCLFQKRLTISLREFRLANKKSRWIVDAQTLATKIVEPSELKNCQSIDMETLVTSATDPLGFNFEYFRVLKKSSIFPGHIQNQGIINDFHHRKDSYLTIDLCPSKSPLDRSFFEQIIQSHWPVGIAISGLWILKHNDDWKWLRSQLVANEVTWINHSRNHPVFPERPMEQNYLLSEGRDIQKEIIDNEKLLFENGITPSIFFRFPGLVANQEALNITLKLGLVTIGSNAWLAKGQKPKPGNIILVHGNGNDPKGLALFQQYWKGNKFPLPFHNLLDIFNLTLTK